MRRRNISALTAAVNVLEQVVSLCNTPVVQDAWARKQKLTIHGWIYGLKDGLMHDLGITVDQPGDLVPFFTKAKAVILKAKIFLPTHNKPQGETA